MLPHVILILLVALLAVRGKPGFFLRRLVRYFAILAILVMIIAAFENRLSLPDPFDLAEMPVMLTVLLFLPILWVFVDLVPILKERKRSPG